MLERVSGGAGGGKVIWRRGRPQAARGAKSTRAVLVELLVVLAGTTSTRALAGTIWYYPVVIISWVHYWLGRGFRRVLGGFQDYVWIDRSFYGEQGWTVPRAPRPL